MCLSQVSIRTQVEHEYFKELLITLRKVYTLLLRYCEIKQKSVDFLDFPARKFKLGQGCRIWAQNKWILVQKINLTLNYSFKEHLKNWKEHFTQYSYSKWTFSKGLKSIFYKKGAKKSVAQNFEDFAPWHIDTAGAKSVNFLATDFFRPFLIKNGNYNILICTVLPRVGQFDIYPYFPLKIS